MLGLGLGLGRERPKREAGPLESGIEKGEGNA
jgi:hypothetical protein